MEAKQHLTLRVHPDTMQAIRSIAEKTGMTQAEVISSAMQALLGGDYAHDLDYDDMRGKIDNMRSMLFELESELDQMREKDRLMTTINKFVDQSTPPHPSRTQDTSSIMPPKER